MSGFFTRLRSRLLLLACLVLLPFCALIAELASHYYRFAVDSVYQDVAALSRLLNTAQNEKIEDARQLMMMIAGMPSIRDRQGDYCGIIAEVRKRHASEYVDLELTNADGKSLCGSAARTGRAGIDGEKWFRQSLQTHQFAVGAYELDAATGKAVAVVVQPILDDHGSLLGAIYAALDLAWISRLNALATLPEHSIVLMFDQNGLVLRRDPQPHLWVGKRHQDAPFLKKIMSGGQAGLLEMPALDGVRRLIAYETLPSQNGKVYLAVGVPNEVAFAGLRKKFFTVGLMFALTIVAALALFWFVADKLIVSRVDRLAVVARRFAEEDYAARSGMAYTADEIGELAKAFDAMAEAIKRRGKQLERYYFALNQHAIVSTADLSGNITFVNGKFCEISGYSRSDLIGQNHRMLNSGFHPPQFFEEMWHAISNGMVWQGVIRNQRKDGSFYWVVSTIVPQLDEHGLPAYYLSIRTDITASLKIKEALERSEEKFRLLAENSYDIVALHDPDGRFVYVSPSLKTVLGYDYAEMVGAEPCHLIHPKDLPMVRRELHQAVLNGEKRASAIFRMRRQSGEYIWIEAVCMPVQAPDGKMIRIQSTLRDVSLRKEAEDRLRLRDKAIQASPSGIVLFSNEKGYPVIYVNPAFEAVTGYSWIEAVGCDMPFQMRHAADGSDIEKIQTAIQQQREGRALARFTHRDGAFLWLDLSVAPVRNEEGEVTHFVAAFTDMTERMAMMEELMQAKEASEQASQAKSEFLSRMTHELRTPLNFILGFAQLLEAQPESLSGQQLDGVQRIIKSGWHLRELIDEVLDLARIESGKLEVDPEDVRLSSLVDECRGIVELTAAEREIRIVSSPTPAGIECMRADRMRIRQVLLNLLSNAVKFNRPGGTVSIKQELTASGNVRITVCDTGPGIDNNRLGELFQPFSRLGADKAEIPGTGIGLAISRRFMELMGGEIGVNSVVGEGSSFWIELPSVRDCPQCRERCASACTDFADALQADGGDAGKTEFK